MAKLKKIQASTLIESIVAMVLITLAFGIAFLIFLNLSRTNNPTLKFKAYTVTQKIVLQSKAAKEFFDESFQVEALLVERKILSYADKKNLRVLQIKVYNNSERLILEKRELVKVP